MVMTCRCDELKRQYIGALCGLGCDPKKSSSLYQEHDMEITFDTLFTQQHLNLVHTYIHTYIHTLQYSGIPKPPYNGHPETRTSL